MTSAANAAADCALALATILGLVQTVLEEHHAAGVNGATECEVCRPYAPAIGAAYDQVEAALAELRKAAAEIAP